MFNKLLKLLVISVIFYQTPVYSKSASFNEFNSRDLSNYFSGIVAFENRDNSDALKFFNSSKVLLKKHDLYLKRYVYSLVLDRRRTKGALHRLSLFWLFPIHIHVFKRTMSTATAATLSSRQMIAFSENHQAVF